MKVPLDDQDPRAHARPRLVAEDRDHSDAPRQPGERAHLLRSGHPVEHGGPDAEFAKRGERVGKG